MKILGVLLQSKKGDPLVIASAPSLLTRTIILYSNLIFANILQNYRRRQKIQRRIILEVNLECILTITKDYIFYVYINKAEIGLAFDAIRKVTQYFNNNTLKIFQGAKTGQGKLEMINKKFVEFMSMFEEFLYTRELSVKEYLPLQPQTQSKRKQIDFQIFNKFSHISQQGDKRIILDMTKTSNKIATLQVKKRMKIVEHMKKFAIKNQDQLDLLEADPKKQKFMNNYRKNLINFARAGRKKQIDLISRQGNEKQAISTNNFFIDEDIMQESRIQKEKIQLKLMEKLQLHLFQGKIKEVIQFGQIIVEGTQEQKAKIELKTSSEIWKNSKILNKRVSPNSLKINQLQQTCYEFEATQGYKSKPIIDYIIRKQTFTPDKIPLLFLYTMQVKPTNIEFYFKYKINEKWREPLKDIQIGVYLNPEFVVTDIFTEPTAFCFKSQKVVWKTKEITQQIASKGKILLSFKSSNVPPKKIIKEIKLAMKCPHKTIIEGLSAQCIQEDGQKNKAEKTLLISYKVQPNQ